MQAAVPPSVPARAGDPPTRVRILTLGDTLSGKSCFIKRYCEGRFVQKYISTIGIDYGVRRAVVGGHDLRLNFFDTGGVPAYIDVRNEFYMDAQAVMLVFDATNRRSFENLSHWWRELSEHLSGQEVPVVLVATKCDLSRAVSVEEAQSWADDHHARFFEASAQSGAGVAPAVESLCASLLRAADCGPA